MRVESTDPYEIQPDEPVVVLQEEFGFRLWIWLPGMTATALEEWWHALPSVLPYFFDPSSLPGKMCLVRTEAQRTQYHMLAQSNQHYLGHIHEDNDSVLIRPDQTRIRHRGFHTS